MQYQKKQIPTLDGWRALSVIGVILFHGRMLFFGENSRLTRAASHLYLGVEIFFAISGFLICTLLLQEYERFGSIDLRRFYIRRLFRILPPYYVAMAVICLVSLFGAIQVNYSDLPSCLLFYRNYKPLGMDLHGGYYTAHFWSLAVEEHFYLIWPILLVAVTPKRAGKAAVLLATAVFSWRVLEAHFLLYSEILPPSNLLTRSDTRVDALLWGCLAAIYFSVIQRHAQRIRFSQLWLPIFAILTVSLVLHRTIPILLYSVLFPALVLSTVLQPGSVLGRFLEWRPLRWIGGLSYSLYLWQELFLPELASERAHNGFRYLQQGPWNVLAILACALLSRYLVEIPMNRLGHRLSEATSPLRLSGPTPALNQV